MKFIENITAFIENPKESVIKVLGVDGRIGQCYWTQSQYKKISCINIPQYQKNKLGNVI